VNVPDLSPADAQWLSRQVWKVGNARDPEMERVNDWLKAVIEVSAKCTFCHGDGTCNFEQAAGWDGPCPKCGGSGLKTGTESEGDAG